MEQQNARKVESIVLVRAPTAEAVAAVQVPHCVYPSEKFAGKKENQHQIWG